MYTFLTLLTTMKRSFLTILFFLLAAFATLQAENFIKYIVSRPTERGMLYFVLPSKAECREEGAHKRSNLTFDVTYISPGDSLRLNTSLLFSVPQKVDSLTFRDAQGKNHTFPTERLYLEPRKSKWELRLSIQLPYALWQTLLSAQTPLTFRFSHKGQPVVSYSFSDKAWHRQQGIYQLIEQMKND